MRSPSVQSGASAKDSNDRNNLGMVASSPRWQQSVDSCERRNINRLLRRADNKSVPFNRKLNWVEKIIKRLSKKMHESSAKTASPAAKRR